MLLTDCTPIRNIDQAKNGSFLSFGPQSRHALLENWQILKTELTQMLKQLLTYVLNIKRFVSDVFSYFPLFYVFCSLYSCQSYVYLVVVLYRIELVIYQHLCWCYSYNACRSFLLSHMVRLALLLLKYHVTLSFLLYQYFWLCIP